MDLDDVKNDIKMLFFIVNSLVGLLTGLVALSAGVAFGTTSYYPGATAGCVVGGLIALAIAALGYAGAILQNRIMLFIYAGIMMLAVVGEIVGAAVTYGTQLAPIITYLGLTALAMIMAMILAVTFRKQTDQGMTLGPAPAAYAPVAYNISTQSGS